MCRKERYFELRLSKAAHSYALQYSKGININVTDLDIMNTLSFRINIGPGKKAKGEIRIDEVFGMSA